MSEYEPLVKRERGLTIDTLQRALRDITLQYTLNLGAPIAVSVPGKSTRYVISGVFVGDGRVWFSTRDPAAVDPQRVNVEDVVDALAAAGYPPEDIRLALERGEIVVRKA